MRFSELIAKKDLTNRERDDLVTQARIMEAALYDQEDLVNAFKRSGFVFTPGRVLAGQRNVVFDKDGITLRPAENSIFNWAVLSWEPADDAGRWYGVLGCYLTGSTPNRSGMVGLAAQNESGGSGIAQLDLQAAGSVIAWIKMHSTSGIDINAAGADLDTQIQGENVTDVFKVDAGRNQVLVGTSIAIKERADNKVNIAGYGQIWVKNTTPCELWFTDDAGIDMQLA